MDERGRHAGRTLMVGIPGPELDPRTAERLVALEPGGLIVFRAAYRVGSEVSAKFSEQPCKVLCALLRCIDQVPAVRVFYSW